jgi:hypothetical protein
MTVEQHAAAIVREARLATPRANTSNRGLQVDLRISVNSRDGYCFINPLGGERLIPLGGVSNPLKAVQILAEVIRQMEEERDSLLRAA